MKNKILNILIIFFLLFFSFQSLSASEIFGTISTSMNNKDDLLKDDVDEPIKPLNNSSGGVLVFSSNNQSEEQEEIKVLGVSQYADGALVRGSDQRIYVIYGEFKNYICSLAKLQRYAGQLIYDISDEDLEQYQIRNYTDGDLIREKGEAKIFLITKDSLKHILNLEELRINFQGQEIFNVSQKEMRLYY